jgi:pimeloyl-ACP methyl ester carboxylesterase
LRQLQNSEDLEVMAHFLLVHGGMLGGWCWKKVRKYLENNNHKVLTPTLTGLGDRRHLSSQGIDLDLHISDIVNTVFYEDWENVILVGHSYAGMVITGAADRIPQKIARVIYLDAVLPNDGESMFDSIDPTIAAHLYKRALEKGNGWEVPPDPIENYGWDIPEDAAWFTSRCTAHPLKCFQQPLHLSGNSVKKEDRIYIKCTQNSALDSMLVRAKSMGIPCHFFDAGHFPMITHPQKLAEVLRLFTVSSI